MSCATGLNEDGESDRGGGLAAWSAYSGPSQCGVTNLTSINTATPMARWPNSGSTSCAPPRGGLARSSWRATIHRALRLDRGLGCPVPYQAGTYGSVHDGRFL